MWETIDKLSGMASFYLKRSQVIEGNIANADTPGFRAKDLVFAQELQKSLPLKKSSSRHLDPTNQDKKFEEIELSNVRGYDDNRVDIQEELAKLAESAIMYKALAENLKKEFEKFKIVINGR